MLIHHPAEFNWLMPSAANYNVIDNFAIAVSAVFFKVLQGARDIDVAHFAHNFSGSIKVMMTFRSYERLKFLDELPEPFAIQS
jgi:hypothetical protein